MKLQVFWIPQVPGKAFNVAVDSVAEGIKIMDVLADYDKFQFENHIKPDYCNAGGLQMWAEDDGDGKPGWVDWYDEETGEDDPKAWLEQKVGELEADIMAGEVPLVTCQACGGSGQEVYGGVDGRVKKCSNCDGKGVV
jgi:hypothetical protein